MIRLFLFLAILLGAPPCARAQIPGAAGTPPGLSQAQATQVLDLLRDDAKRTQLIGVLETLARVAPAAAAGKAVTPAAAGDGVPAQAVPTPSPQAPPPQAAPVQTVPAQSVPAKEGAHPETETTLPHPLVPDSLGARLLVDASEGLSQLSTSVSAAIQSATNFDLLWLSVSYLLTDPWSRDQLFDAGWKLVVVFATALAAERLTRRALRRPILRSESELRARRRQPGEDGAPVPLFAGGRLRIILTRFALEALPVLAVIVVGYVMLGTPLGARQTTRFVILAVLHAYALLRLVFSLSDELFAPNDPALRLLHLSDDAARRAQAWVRRIAVVAILGYVLAEVGLLFGLYRVVHQALLKIVALIVHFMLVIVVLENRAPIAAMIRAKPDASGPFAVLRNRLAAVWHLVASFYILAVWLVWAFEVPDGFSRLIRLFVATFFLSLAVRLLISRARLSLRALLGSGADASVSPTFVQLRVSKYESLLLALWSTVVLTGGITVLLEVMGVDALAWFQGDLGGRLITALRDMALAVMVAIIVWEVANASIQRHLEHLTQSAQATRSARLRTLLPIFRAMLLVLVCLVAGLVVLSEIGVNTAPLLAGAGVLGVAIGFGSQRLVQDVITGLFLLLENAMQVGDVVVLGGLTGTVENLSIRAIRLRAIDGSVHLIPFSAVSTVTNQTRDFSYAVLDLNVGLDQDPDRVGDLLRDIAKTMRSEARWRGAIRDDIEVMGVERFIPTAWVMRARVKTLPGQQWAVGRELNRRIKQRFDELAIDSPMTSYKALGLPTPTPVISITS